MRIGIGSYAYRWGIGRGAHVPERPLRALDLLDKAMLHGVDLVQYADNLPLDRLSPGELAELAAAARERGVAIELGAEGLNRQVLGTYLEIARVVGASLIRVAPSAADAGKPNAAIADEISAVLPAYAAQQVTIAVENHFHVPSPRLVDLVERVGSPQFGVCLDVANSIACEEWPRQTIDLLAPFAVNLHLKDYKLMLDPHGVGLGFVGVPLGQGQTDIDGVFAALGAAGRTVNVILEHWLPFGGDEAETLRREDEWLAISIAALRNRFGRSERATTGKDDAK